MLIFFPFTDGETEVEETSTTRKKQSRDSGTSQGWLSPKPIPVNKSHSLLFDFTYFLFFLTISKPSLLFPAFENNFLVNI